MSAARSPAAEPVAGGGSAHSPLGSVMPGGKTFRPGKNLQRGLLGQKNSLRTLPPPPLSMKSLLVSTVKAYCAPGDNLRTVYSARPLLTAMFRAFTSTWTNASIHSPVQLALARW